MSGKKRITWIDTIKGFAIFLLLFSHSMAEYDLFKNWIFAFHMPIFFFICGYLVNLKYKDGFKSGQFKDLLSKRWYNLFLPYFFFGLILIIFFSVIRLVSGNPSIALSQLLDLVSMNGIESLWFLPVYFFSEVLLITILGVSKGKARFCIIFLIIGLLCVINQTSLKWPFDVFYEVAEGAVFVFAGFIFASNEIETIIPIKYAIVLFIVASLATTLNQGASMNNMNIVPLYFFNAIAISLSLIAIIHRLGERYGHHQLLTFYGKNSLIILCTNNIIIETVRLIDFKLTNNSLIHMGYLGVFIFFIILTICEYPLLKLFAGKFNRQYILSLKSVKREG